jgi:hypothetical protein
MKAPKRPKVVKDYLKHLKPGDLLQAVHQARHKATERLYDQGVTALALVLSEMLADVLQRPEQLSKELAKR